MKRILVAMLMACVMLGCGKDENTSTPVTPGKTAPPKAGPTDKIVLNEGVYAGDSVKLSWSILDTTAFKAYGVYRKDSPDAPFLLIKEYSAKESVTFTDKNLPYSQSLQYQVSGLTTGKTIQSNMITVARPDIKVIDGNPYDVIYNKIDRTLYFFEKTGKISIYDVAQNKVIRSINSDATIGYADFGVFEGQKELYVPRNDGWVFVYDALSLEKVAYINTGLKNSSVVYYNNTLYVSTSAWTNRPLKVYDRKTGVKISENGDFDQTRLRMVPGSNFELVEISMYISPVDQDYYKFSNDGKFITHLDDRYHGDYPLDAAIFEFFPDGSRYITATSGAVYNKDMQYLGSLPRGNLFFNTYAIGADDKLIYAGGQTKNIYVYTTQDYTYVKTLTTKGYPFKLIDLGNQLLCISFQEKVNLCLYCTPTASTAKVFIELIDKK